MPESLPLSASPPPDRVSVRLLLESGRGTETRTVDMERGATVRRALRKAGQSPEGCAVLECDTPLPLDLPIDRDLTLTVVRTFSGG